MNFRFWIFFTICLFAGFMVGRAAEPPHKHDGWVTTFPEKNGADSALALVRVYDNGPAIKIAAGQNFLVFSQGGFLEVADISEPSAPVYTGHVYIGCVPEEMRISDNRLVALAPRDEFIFVSLHNPEAPEIKYRFHPAEGMVLDWDIEGELLVIALENRIQIFQTLPDEPPLLLSELTAPQQSVFDAVDLNGTQLYAHAYQKNFIWDLFNPAKPELLLESAAADVALDLAGNASKIVGINSEMLWLYRYGEDGVVQSTTQSVWGGLDSRYKLILQNNGLFVLNKNRQLEFFRLEENQGFQKYYTLTKNLLDFAVKDSTVYMVMPDGCYYFRFANREAAPTKIFNTAAPFSRLIKDAPLPLLIRKFALPGHTAASASPEKELFESELVFGQTVCVLNQQLIQLREDSLFIFKLDKNRQVEFKIAFKLEYSYSHITTAGNRIYLSSYTNGLVILQLQQERLEVLGLYPELSFGKVIVQGGLLYGENINTLDIYKIRLGERPEWLSSYQPGGLIKDFSVASGKIALSVDDSGIWLLNAQEPGNLQLLTWYPGRFKKCLLTDSYLIVTPGIKFFKLEDGKELVLKSEREFPDSEGRVTDLMFGEDQRIYVLHENLGLFVFENQLIKKDGKAPSICSHYPNPFNSVISIQYQVQAAGLVRVDVFNVQGHLVKSLVNQNQDVGEHFTRWDATNEQGQPVASGVYLYRVQTPTQSETQKILLIR